MLQEEGAAKSLQLNMSIILFMVKDQVSELSEFCHNDYFEKRQRHHDIKTIMGIKCQSVSVSHGQ